MCIRDRDAEDLSKETLEWLDWYNSLPEEQQLAVSFVPSDLIEETLSLIHI